MLEKEFHISRLIAKHFRGQLSINEEQELNLWLSMSKDNRDYFNSLNNEKNISAELQQYERIKNTTKEEVWKTTLLKLGASFTTSGQQPEVKVSLTKLWTFRWIAIAASILLVAGTFVILNHHSGDDRYQPLSAKNDLSAGGNKAYITLANGKTIPLSSTKTGIIINAATLKYNDGTSIPVEQSEYSTITTPRGGQYQITLSDGTIVYMNAESSLQYPSAFNGPNRTIILDGEAYFEVAKDKKHPFIVKSNGQKVEVLGTHFNINSYDDEPVVKTTLLEGRVAVSSLKDSVSLLRNGTQVRNDVILSPGQQSALSDAGAIKVNTVDTQNAVAWKNGDFVFNGDDLKTVMRQLARWYNIEVAYQGNLSDIGFVSTISRGKKLSEVLKALEATQGVHFKIDGRRILVMP